MGNTEKEFNAVFNMTDLLDTGKITWKECEEALLTLANSQKQYKEIAAHMGKEDSTKTVNRSDFCQLAMQLLGK